MLTGELPLGKFPPPSRKVQVDVRLDEVVLHALEKEPERRYQQASQVKTAVETIAGSASVPASPPGALPPRLGEFAHPAPEGSAARPARAEDWWSRLRWRLWPPLVGRRDGRRVIHWPALAMRGLRGLMIVLVYAFVGSVLPRVPGFPWPGLPLGTWLAGVILVLITFVLTIRVLRGFATPLDRLPDLGASGRPANAAGGKTSRLPLTIGAGVATFFLVFLVTAVVTFSLPKSYRAVARVRFDSPGLTDVRAADLPGLVATERAIIISAPVLGQAVTSLDLTQRWQAKYGQGRLSQEQIRALLRRTMEVRTLEGFGLEPQGIQRLPMLEIRCWGDTPQESAEIANAIAAAYCQARVNLGAALIDRAEPPLRPFRPNVALNLALGALGGLVLGLPVWGSLWLMGVAPRGGRRLLPPEPRPVVSFGFAGRPAFWAAFGA